MKKVGLVLFAAIIVTVLVLSGCAKVTPSTPPTTSTAQPVPTTTATTIAPTTSKPAVTTTTTVPPKTTAPVPTQVPITTPKATVTAQQYGGVLKLLNSKSPLKFGYPVNIAGEDREYSRGMLENLITFDDSGAYVPWLATSWEISPDGLSYIFKLRQGVKFHDGTDFNAAAAKWNLDIRISNPGGVLTSVKSIDVVDDYTIRLNLKQPDVLVLWQLADGPTVRMISPTAVQKNGIAWAETNPVGTGPYVFKEFKKNTSVEMVKNNNFWDPKLPYMDGMKYIIIVDKMTQMVAFKAGEANALIQPDPAIASQLREAGYQSQGGTAQGGFIYGDSKNPSSPFAKKEVRLAVEYAIDKEEICSTIGKDMYLQMFQIAGLTHPALLKDLVPRKYDVAKAKQLLKDAGYANGFKTTLYTDAASWKEGYTAIQSYLAAVGINVELQWITTALYDEIRLSKGLPQPNTMTHGGVGQSPHLLAGIVTSLPTYSGYYPDFARPAGLDALVTAAQASTSSQKEIENTQKIIKLIYDDATVIPIWSNLKLVFYDKTVMDPHFAVANFGNERDYMTVWLKK